MTLNEQRDRLLRILAGAILLNALDRSEIDAFCSLLATDSKVGLDVSNIITAAVSGGSSIRSNSKVQAVVTSKSRAPRPGAAEIIFASIQKQKITKRRCLESMKRANPKFITPNGFDKMSVKDLVKRYLSQSSNDQVDRLLGNLEGSDIDPYLRGISKTRQSQ